MGVTTTSQVTTERVWELLSARLGSFIRSRVRDEQTADDLLQETFLRIHRKLGTLDDEQRLFPWVFQIARNLIADHYRSRPAALPLTEPPAEDAEPEPSSSNCNEVVAGWIPAAIDHLPERYREAVRLYEMEGLSQREVADRLGLSLSGAKSRVQRGRKQLKATLEQCCSFELDRRGNILDWRQRRQRCLSCDEED